MIKKKVALLCFSLALSFNIFAKEDKIVAQFKNGMKITEGDISSYMNKYLNSTSSFDSLQQEQKLYLVNSMVALKISEYDAEEADKSENYRKKKDFQNELEAMTKQLLVNFRIKDFIDRNVTQQDVEEAYNKYVEAAKGKEEFNLVLVLLKDKNEADKFATVFKNAKNNLEKAYENYPDKTNVVMDKNWFESSLGGDQKLSEEISKIKVGQVGGPYQTKEGGFIYAKFLGKRPVQIQNKAELLPNIKNQIGINKYQQHLKELSNKLELKINLPNAQSVIDSSSQLVPSNTVQPSLQKK